MKNIFLNGPVGIGKSTVIDKVLAEFTGTVGGFRSWFGPDRHEPEHCLYLSGVDKLFALPAARFEREAAAEVMLATFNGFGRALLDDAAGSDLIIMDELGKLEGMAEEFQDAVLRALDGPSLVLGVMRHDARGWLTELRARPDVALLDISEENRDALPGQILDMLKR